MQDPLISPVSYMLIGIFIRTIIDVQIVLIKWLHKKAGVE